MLFRCHIFWRRHIVHGPWDGTINYHDTHNMYEEDINYDGFMLKPFSIEVGK